MTKHEVAALICKVLGIYAFVGALNSLPLVLMPAVISMVNASSGASPIEGATRLGAIINALPVVFQILAGLFLWLGADNLARRMVKDTKTVVEPVIGQAAQIVAFSTLGLFTLLQAIPRAGQILTNLYILSRQDALIHRDFKGLTTPDIVGLLIQLALGLWLLFGSSGLVNLLQSFRSVGMDKQNHAAVDTQ